MNANSAPGPDGFGGGFYQLCWDIIKEDLQKVVRSFFAGKSLIRPITSTAIVLIPKVPNPATFNQFRPISLSNFCSEIITKILVQRLAGILARIISPVQVGFVKGRSIIDNVLLAQEICHGMKASNEDMILKLDMTKAYDRMDWGCITNVLKRLALCQKWIELVSGTINNIWYSVVVNGESKGFFHSSRGLRQGDPLSPSLFILAAELFSRLLSQKRSLFSQPMGSPGINHLAFADDMVIFTSGKNGGIQEIMEVLETYEKQSGQLINKQKSAFYVHPRAPDENIERIRDISGCQHKNFPFTYLGCPIYEGRKRVEMFNGLMERIAERCKGWHARVLSQGGKAVLIKTILQAMPTHICYAINPPKAIIKHIEKLFSDFFWGKREDKNKYHWGSWKTLARPTKEGGVGFLKMQELVDAASAKLWWNFRRGGTIWCDFMMAKYCRDSHPVVIGWQYKDSHIWRRMAHVRDRVEPQVAWQVERGELNVWWDDWSGKGALASVMNLRGKRKAKEKIKDAVVDNRVNLQRLSGQALGQVQDWNVAMQLTEREDKAIWKPTGKEFTFRTAKELMRESGTHHVGLWCKKIWAKGVPWKMSFLTWRVFMRKLPTDDVLRRMGYQFSSRCSCYLHPGCDELQHIFGTGGTARHVWDYFAKSMGMRVSVRSERHICYEWWKFKWKNRMMEFMAQRLPMLILWELWVNYNHCKYGGGRPSVARIIYKVTKDMAECIQRKWPYWDPLPPNWMIILRKAESFGCVRIVQRSCWVRPGPGAIKINWAVDDEERSCSFFVRNSSGRFCLAGVYTLREGQDLKSLIQEMMRYCWSWCNLKRMEKVSFETNNWRETDLDCLSLQGHQVRMETCLDKVNCVAICLANRCFGLDIIFSKVEGLPRGLEMILALEGVPHFVFFPGVDRIR
ncbi:PREDICTED: uncharacterized protein LOC109185694 [Ipomoea nil]|uniref:uncharacterized protein LOC109185694 n=1 Tax=Ipomoea nil TaxID=35883 RepID=UPI000900D097|nr:PREDICTED: uncharacterized protein LOC109185694 [Ipomoea nil]